MDSPTQLSSQINKTAESVTLLPTVTKNLEEGTSYYDVAKPVVLKAPAITADKKFRAVALDLDGTLLNSQHKLSDVTKTYLRHLDQRGFCIIIATGRAINTVHEVVLALDLPRPIPVVSSNGAMGSLCQVVAVDENNDNNNDEPLEAMDRGSATSTTSTPSATTTTTCNKSVHVTPLFDSPVPLPIAQRTIQLAQQLGHVSQYYVNGHVYADPVTADDFARVRLYRELTGAQTIALERNKFVETVTAMGLPSKLLVLFPPQAQDAAMAGFQNVMMTDASLLVDNRPATLIRGYLGWFLEVLHPLVCKGMGLQRMCRQHLQVPIQQTIAFGDGDNDVEFIQYSGWGVVMQNGRRVAKKVADQVLEWTNDEDGVVRTLQNLEQRQLLEFSSSKVEA